MDLPRSCSAEQQATSERARVSSRSAAIATCCRAQTSSPRERSESASSSATLIMAYAHSQPPTTVSKSSPLSRGRTVIQSSETLRRTAAVTGRERPPVPSDADMNLAFRLGNTTSPQELRDYSTVFQTALVFLTVCEPRRYTDVRLAKSVSRRRKVCLGI